MIAPSRQAGTVNNTWLNGSHTVFGWAAKHKHIPRNPFTDVNVTVPKRTKLRETQAFYPEEQRLILKAAPHDFEKSRNAAVITTQTV